MKEHTVNVHYITDGKMSVLPTKILYKQIDEDEFRNIHCKISINNDYIQSKESSSFEVAIRYLQKELPNNIRIACCQSCQHGNFNPFGDVENEIFCLKEVPLQNPDDVVNFFCEQFTTYHKRSRKLLDYCTDYKPICAAEKYTYNDWD